MLKREAERLASRIVQEDHSCDIVSLNKWAVGSYTLSVRDNRTGYQFDVRSPDEWDERRRAAREEG